MILAHGDSVEHHSDANARVRATVVVTNPQGLHMRPAMAFARAAQQCSCSVTIWHGDRSVNGKSLIDLMIAAVEPGTELVVELVGDGAHSALPLLVEILGAPAAADELADETADSTT